MNNFSNNHSKFYSKIQNVHVLQEMNCFLRAYRVITVVHGQLGETSREKQRIIRTNQAPHRTRQNSIGTIIITNPNLIFIFHRDLSSIIFT